MKMSIEVNRPTNNGEIFVSKVRSAGDLAGVFEYDGETGYFYLYDERHERNHRVVGAIHVLSTAPDFHESDVRILWDATETCVGLVIRDHVWAAFDTRTGAKYGGDYRAHGNPDVPEGIVRSLT
jgi:hypothetical protein